MEILSTTCFIYFSDLFFKVKFFKLSIFVSDIQEFYELTLLDETKSVQEKTAETIRIANKWETNDGPIATTYVNNDVSTTKFKYHVLKTLVFVLKVFKPRSRFICR